MIISRNFDPVADIYDETRVMPEPVLRYGIPAILDVIGPRAHVLEPGTGTGRIAIPLLERGVDVIGIDLSRKMMARQRAKYTAARLAQASALDLPFGDGRFDVVLTAHVLHLIPDWQAALAEFKRVLRPFGVYLNVRSESTGDSPLRRATAFWREWLLARDGLPHGERIGPWDQEQINPVLEQMGATVTTIDAVTYPTYYTLRDRVQRTRNRSFSSSWDVDDDLLQASADALEAWITAEYGSLDVEMEDEQVFRIHVAQF